MRFRCPHCDAFGNVQKTVRDEVNPLLASFYVRCSNLYCGHTWRMDTQASVTTRPSMTPAPELNLPKSKHLKAKEAAGAQGMREHTTHHLPGVEPHQDF